MKVYSSTKYEGEIRTMILEYPQIKHEEYQLLIPRIVDSFKDI